MRQLNGNFDVLRRMAGEGSVGADVDPSFPLDRLGEPENFLSLHALLRSAEHPRCRPRLGIPNQTVRRLMYSYLRDGYRDVGVFSVSHHRFANLMRDMVYRGAWRPALRHQAEAIATQTRNIATG